MRMVRCGKEQISSVEAGSASSVSAAPRAPLSAPPTSGPATLDSAISAPLLMVPTVPVAFGKQTRGRASPKYDAASSAAAASKTQNSDRDTQSEASAVSTTSAAGKAAWQIETPAPSASPPTVVQSPLSPLSLLRPPMFSESVVLTSASHAQQQDTHVECRRNSSLF